MHCNCWCGGSVSHKTGESVFQVVSFLIFSLKVSDAMERVSRTTYFLGNAGIIVYDYWYSFRKVDRGSPEYEALEHEINERTAKRLFRICE